MRLAAARLFVHRIDEALHFYQQCLGLPLRQDGRAHGFLRFDTGATELLVEVVPPDAPADEQALVGRFSGLSLAVDDLAATHQRLLGAGVPFSTAPERQFWGGWLATLQDPDGNQLQLVQYPPTP